MLPSRIYNVSSRLHNELRVTVLRLVIVTIVIRVQYFKKSRDMSYRSQFANKREVKQDEVVNLLANGPDL